MFFLTVGSSCGVQAHGQFQRRIDRGYQLLEEWGTRRRRCPFTVAAVYARRLFFIVQVPAITDRRYSPTRAGHPATDFQGRCARREVETPRRGVSTVLTGRVAQMSSADVCELF